MTLGKGLYPLAPVVVSFRVVMLAFRGVPLQFLSMMRRYVSASRCAVTFTLVSLLLQSFVLFAATLARFRICIKCNFFGLHQRSTALCVTIALLLVMIVPVTCSRRLYV